MRTGTGLLIIAATCSLIGTADGTAAKERRGSHPAAHRTSVQALLERASGETASRALKTVEEAEQLALGQASRGQRTKDLLAVAETAKKLAHSALHRSQPPDPEGSLALAKRAHSILAKSAPKSFLMAGVFLLFADLAAARENLDEARRFSQRALSIAEANAPLSGASAWAYIQLCTVARLGGDRQSEQRIYESALAVARRQLPPSHASAEGLYVLGEFAKGRQDFASARDLHRRSLEIWQRLGNDQAIAGSLTGLGWIEHYAGDVPAAREHFQRAVTVWERLPPGRDGWGYSSALAGLAFQMRRLEGERTAAKELFQRSLAVCEQALGRDSPELMTPRNGLASLLIQEGNLSAAETFLQESLRLLEKHPNHPDAAAPLRALGALSHKRGDLAAARAYYGRALAVYERRDPESVEAAWVLEHLAWVLDEAGDKQGATELLRRAVQIIESRSSQSAHLSRPLRSLAKLYTDAGQLTEARALLERADKIEDRQKQFPGMGAGASPVYPPLVRFVAPAVNSVVGDEVQIQMIHLSSIPLRRYRVWVNGRPIGPPEGFDLPRADEKGRLLDKGRLLEKGDLLGPNRVFERGRLLEKGKDRAVTAKGLPDELAELLKKPQYAHFLEIRHTVPLEDTDGQFIRIAVQVETTGNSVSDRHLLRLLRPEAEEKRGSLRVLTVGIGDYQNLPKLKYAPADAVALAGVFQGQSGMDDDHRLYRGSTIVTRTDVDASLERIRGDLDRLVEETRPGDTVIVALSGHGVTKDDQTWFAPVRFDPENAAGTGLAWKEVLAKLEEVRKTARAVWLLADCCRAAPGLRREEGAPRQDAVVAATTRDLKRGVEEGGNLIVVTASSGDHPSYESEELKQGLFTRAWLEALRGEAPELVYEEAARGRVLTLSRLQFWLDASVSQHARKAGVRQRVEFPRLEGSFSPSTPVFVPVSP